MKQNNSENTPENTDLVRKYNDRYISTWLVEDIKGSEGYRENAYVATEQERKNGQWTIGYGTSYLFKEDGRPFRIPAVKQGHTLTGLKSLMGYSHMTNPQFAEQILKNHVFSVEGSNVKVMPHLDKLGLPYIERLRDAIMEFAYGSNRMYRSITSPSFQGLVNAIKTMDLNNIAGAYAYWRWNYLKQQSQWRTGRFSWMRRVFRSAMWIKEGKHYKEVQTSAIMGGYKNALGYEKAFRQYLGIIISMS